MDQQIQAELLQCFDEHGLPESVHSREEVCQKPYRFRYAVARVWLVNDQGQILCSQRGQSLSRHAGKWQTYFGGHVQAGRTIKETAQIELEEEAGISIPLHDFYLVEKGYISHSKIFFESYVVKFSGNVPVEKLSQREILHVRWLSMDEYQKEAERCPDDWCNPCSPENQYKIRTWLTDTRSS